MRRTVGGVEDEVFGLVEGTQHRNVNIGRVVIILATRRRSVGRQESAQVAELRSSPGTHKVQSHSGREDRGDPGSLGRGMLLEPDQQRQGEEGQDTHSQVDGGQLEGDLAIDEPEPMPRDAENCRIRSPASWI